VEWYNQPILQHWALQRDVPTIRQVWQLKVEPYLTSSWLKLKTPRIKKELLPKKVEPTFLIILTFMNTSSHTSSNVSFYLAVSDAQGLKNILVGSDFGVQSCKFSMDVSVDFV
jgi:hypothetical protein